MLKYNHVPVAQWIEQTRPKGEMQVRLPPGILNMTRSEAIRFLILRTIGNFLVLFAIFGVIATFGPAVYYEFTFKIMQARGVHFQISPSVALAQNQVNPQKDNTVPVKVSGGGFADILAGPKTQILTPIDTHFDILIPKIGANAKFFQMSTLRIPTSSCRFYSRELRTQKELFFRE